MKVWDLHCDTLSELRRAEKNGTPASFAHNDLHIDLEKLQAGDYMLQCLAAFVNLADPTPGADPLVTALEEIDVFKRIMATYPESHRPGVHGGRHPQKRRSRKDQRPAHRGGGWLLQGQPGRAAPDV